MTNKIMKKLSLIPSEMQELECLCRYLDARKLLYHHSPNESRGPVQYFAARKKRGVKAGFPDIMIFEKIMSGLYPLNCLCGIAIELKRRYGGYTTLAQERWLDELRKRGWITKVCRGHEEAIKLIEQYLPVKL